MRPPSRALLIVLLAFVLGAGPTSVASAQAVTASATVTAALPELRTDPGEVRRAADEVLDRGAFRPPDQGLWQRLADEVLRRGRELASRLLGAVETNAVAWSVVAVVVVAAGFGAVWWLRRLRPDRGVEVSTGQSARRGSREWSEAAAAHAEAGRWREAARCQYRSLLAALDERGLVEDTPGRTVGEWRRAVAAAAPRAHTDFAAASDLFEATWYAHRPADADTLGRLRTHGRHVLAGGQSGGL